jgi:hypothetical protein
LEKSPKFSNIINDFRDKKFKNNSPNKIESIEKDENKDGYILTYFYINLRLLSIKFKIN